MGAQQSYRCNALTCKSASPNGDKKRLNLTGRSNSKRNRSHCLQLQTCTCTGKWSPPTWALGKKYRWFRPQTPQQRNAETTVETSERNNDGGKSIAELPIGHQDYGERIKHLTGMSFRALEKGQKRRRCTWRGALKMLSRLWAR